MAEEWVAGEDEAQAKVCDIVLGRGSVADINIDRYFDRTDLARQQYAFPSGWCGWEFTSRQTQSRPDIYLRQDALMAFGLRPYGGAPEAIARWLFENENPRHHHGNTAPYQHAFVTRIPDTRARILKAEWLPGVVTIELDVGVPHDEIEVQFLFSEARNDACIAKLDGPSVQAVVPSDALNVWILVVHRTNDCIAQVRLNQVYDVFGERAASLGPVKQAEADLQSGETDHVEYKPWAARNSAKEQEIVETVIAFSNAGGGRLYLGVDDAGAPLGSNQLTREFKADEDAAIAEQISNVKRLAREKIKPVPNVRVDAREVFGERIVVLEIDHGTNGPYSTHDNKAYIRKGGTNRLADPQTELRRPESPFQL